MAWRWLGAALATGLGWPGFASGDTLTLRNGDVLRGKMTALLAGNMSFAPEGGGSVTVPWASVASLEADAPARLVAAGRLFDARIVRCDDDGLEVLNADGTRERLTRAELTAVNPPPARPAWSGYAELGAKRTSGNKDTEGVTVGGEAVWTGEANKITLKSLFRYSEVEKEITERSTYGNAKWDIGLGPPSYFFVAEEGLSDKFKDLRVRSISSAGLGLTLVHTAAVTFAMESGYAWVSEHFVEAENASASSLRVSGTFKVALSPTVRFEDSFQAYPSLERNQDYQGRNEASLITSLGGNWGLRIGTILEYDSRPPLKTLERADMTHLATVQYRF